MITRTEPDRIPSSLPKPPARPARHAVLPCIAAAVAIAFTLGARRARADLAFTERISVETFAALREVERYQLKVAERFYLQGEFAVALDEYDKFLTLYESSPGAPYAQLMWSHCQRRLRQVNTAIREGFQSVIDYWPESGEAVLARYLIADSYRSIGEVERAEPAYREVIREHPAHFVAVHAKAALLEMARTAKQEEKRLALLRDLAFDTKRDDATSQFCIEASRELASIALARGSFDDAAAALATSYPEDSIVVEIVGLAGDPIRRLRETGDSAEPADRLAGRIIAELEQRIPESLDAEESRATARATLYGIAAIHGAAGRENEVMATYVRSGKLLGEDDPLLDRMAEWHKARQERDAAAVVYRRFNDRIEGRRRLVGMLREDAKWPEAIEEFRELMRLDPGRADEYRWAVAECFEASGDLREAIASFRLCEGFPANHFRMAACHRRLEEYEEALTLYRQVRSAGQDAAEADLQIAYTWEESGRRENAIKAFQLTCKAHPRSGQASQAHSHLQDRYGISITLGGAKDD